jgi:tetratricopeptide (TPR) repeat protein
VFFAILLTQVSAQQRSTETPPIGVLLDQYRSGAFDAAVKPLTANIDHAAPRDVVFADTDRVKAAFEGAEAWINAVPAEAAHRRLIAGAFALEVAHARMPYDLNTLVLLLDQTSKGWRKGPASELEHRWMLAAVALVERTLLEGLHTNFDVAMLREGGPLWGGGFLDRAVSRFPDEPRFRLARTLIRVSRASKATFEKLAADPAVRGDALVQLSYLEFSDRRCDAAIRLAREAIDATPDTGIRYVAHFIQGTCHAMGNKAAEAVADYVAALKAVPGGQSASIALALLLAQDSQFEEAFDLVDRSVTERPDGDDPWRLFSYGGYHRFPSLLADLRRAVVQ